MATRRLSIISLLVAAAFPAAIQVTAQDAGAGGETLIRSETRVVLVDTAATDKKGNFIRDLTAKNFRIWEDGKEQTISSFSLEADSPAETRSKHYFLLYFDNATLDAQNQLEIRREAARFVEAFTSPDRLMAVLNYGSGGTLSVAQNFTANAALLQKAVGTSHVGSIAPRSLTAGTVDRAIELEASRTWFRTLRAVVESVASIRGRKALVLFSRGVPGDVEVSNELRQAVEAANRANVGIYALTNRQLIGSSASPALAVAAPGSQVTAAVQAFQARGAPARGAAIPATRGGPTLSDMGPATSGASQDNTSVLSELSRGTGGYMISSTEDIPALLGRIAQEQDQYYMLGYTPKTESPEGSCHELRVKVDRDGAVLRSRTSYCTTKATAYMPEGKPAAKDLETKVTGAGSGNITGAMSLPYFYAGRNQARVTVSLDVPASVFQFQKVKGKPHAEFNIVGIAAKEDGATAAKFNDIASIDFDSQQQADAFRKTTYHYENQFRIGPGRYNFSAAFNGGANAFGKLESKLVVDPWDGAQPAMSSLVLNQEIQRVPDLAGGLDDSLFDGQKPLIARGVQIAPAANAAFTRSGPVYLYLEVYEPQLTGAAPPELNVQMRVADAKSGEQKIDSGVISGRPFVNPGQARTPIVLSLPTNELAPGRYRLEVTGGRSTDNKTVVRSIEFELK